MKRLFSCILLLASSCAYPLQEYADTAEQEYYRHEAKWSHAKALCSGNFRDTHWCDKLTEVYHQLKYKEAYHEWVSHRQVCYQPGLTGQTLPPCTDYQSCLDRCQAGFWYDCRSVVKALGL